MLKKTIVYLAAATLLTFSGNSLSTAQAQVTSGTVLETMSAAGYTYMYIDSGASKDWVAIPEATVSVGDRVGYSQGMAMQDFHSKSLDRSFPSIIFSAGLASSDQTVAPVTSTPTQDSDNSFAAAVAKEQQTQSLVAPTDMAETSGGSTGAIVPFAEIVVEKASGENSYTIEELFTNASDLNGKKVRMRGKVVKFSANIMGRNWVHLQDGSGNPMNNTHDIVVTTSETVAKDDIIVIEGQLAANKDFGAGYDYAAIIEEAQTIK